MPKRQLIFLPMGIHFVTRSKDIPLDPLPIVLSTDSLTHIFGKMVILERSYPERTIFIQLAPFVTLQGMIQEFFSNQKKSFAYTFQYVI
jgi:hypothetical protein